MVIAHAAIGFKCYFHFWIIKNMDLETVCHFGTPNRRKSQKGLQRRFQEDPHMHPKIDKNSHLVLSVYIGCPPEPQDDPNGVTGIQKDIPKPSKSQS